MKFRIEIDCDNAAFDDDRNGELATILTRVAERLSDGLRLSSRPERATALQDSNGNTVGFVWIEESN
jgi:hypothetical protein